MNIVETICKLEMIFLPSFFDSMEHLPIHLSFEVKVGGPVQYRWMYPFERLDIKSWRTGPVQMDVSIREIRYYSCYVIHN